MKTRKKFDPIPLEIRLWLGLDWDRPENECWEWKMACHKSGYGAVGVPGGGTGKVHRIVYEMVYGVKLTPADFILHLCDNPACANPSHLMRGTAIDNAVDMAVKLRGRFKGLSENYARFLYEKLKRRFEGDPDQGKGCTYTG